MLSVLGGGRADPLTPLQLGKKFYRSLCSKITSRDQYALTAGSLSGPDTATSGEV